MVLQLPPRASLQWICLTHKSRGGYAGSGPSQAKAYHHCSPLVFVAVPRIGAADQDSVRLLAVESCGAFAAALSKEDCASSLLPVVQMFAQVGSNADGPGSWLMAGLVIVVVI